jgi:hypothetical protein
MKPAIPELTHGEGSWVCIAPAGVVGVRVVEVYERYDVERVAELGWSIEGIGTYLANLNDRIKLHNA